MHSECHYHEEAAATPLCSLADILLHDGRDRTNRLRSVKYGLTEVGRVGQAYWGWNEQHWLYLIDQRPALRQLSMTPPEHDGVRTGKVVRTP